MPYGYAGQYVTEEQEEELSESDCPSDAQVMPHVNSDLTELYRRKQQTVKHLQAAAGNYYHSHVPDYYEQSRFQPCTCHVSQEPRYCYKSPQNQEAVFRSYSHITPNLRNRPDTKPASITAVKKYPVTSKTPRFSRHYRQVSKRPSALCLPIACQPDPAMFPRPRKVPAEIQHYRGQETYAINDYVMRTTALKRTAPRPVDSEGDVNSKLNDLENFLTKFEEDENDEDGTGEQVEISGVKDISKILKPKIPPSVKTKQDKIVQLRAVKTNVTETIANVEKVNTLEVKAPDEPIEALLESLTNDKHRAEKNDTPGAKTTKQRQTSRHKTLCYFNQKPPLDDNSALELHKSKSYIVSLIDKALSKELGTIPGDKCTTKEFLNMSPKKAMELVNRHSVPLKNVGKSISLNSEPQGSTSGSKKENQCICNNEEPLYLKQLKQLRWSHLRHIQREAKRLADLERFLDSFSESENPP